MVAAATGEVVELGDGLSLLPCIAILVSVTRADVSVKPVDEWQLKEALTTLLKNRLSLSLSDRDLVVRREKNLFKKRREEPIAEVVLHLWGCSQAKGEKNRYSGRDDMASLIIEVVGGVVLNVGGLKLRCSARSQERNSFEAAKRSWEAALRGYQAGKAAERPNTLVLKGVPSRWFAETRVSSKASVLVTHTIFSKFGDIRNLEVTGNGDVSKVAKEPGALAAALQCQVWVQFENHDSFCNAMEAFCGCAMQKEGSSFKATYVVDWDRESYFSQRNIQCRKFEKERLEAQARQQLAERARRLEIEARQAELVHIEREKLKLEERAQALREEEERQQQAELAQAQEDLGLTGVEDPMMKEEREREDGEWLQREFEEKPMHKQHGCEEEPKHEPENRLEEALWRDEGRSHQSDDDQLFERWQSKEEIDGLEDGRRVLGDKMQHDHHKEIKLQEQFADRWEGNAEALKSEKLEHQHYTEVVERDCEERWAVDVTQSTAWRTTSEMLALADLDLLQNLGSSKYQGTEKHSRSKEDLFQAKAGSGKRLRSRVGRVG